jgi:hypothetical protein
MDLDDFVYPAIPQCDWTDEQYRRVAQHQRGKLQEMKNLEDIPLSELITMSKVRRWWNELPGVAILLIIVGLVAAGFFLLVYYAPPLFK